MKLILTGRSCAIALCLGSATAGAQTCAAPIQLLSNSIRNDNTCAAPTGTGSNSLSSYGKTLSPQNEVIYSFVAQNGSATIVLTDTGAFDAVVFVMPSPCSTSTSPIAFGFAGTTMPVSGLTNGQTYYVIVTANPSGPAATCGAYAVTMSGFPVELQKFSVD